MQNVVYFITLSVLVRKIFTFYLNYVLLFNCPVPRPKGKLSSRIVIIVINSTNPFVFVIDTLHCEVGSAGLNITYKKFRLKVEVFLSPVL